MKIPDSIPMQDREVFVFIAHHIAQESPKHPLDEIAADIAPVWPHLRILLDVDMMNAKLADTRGQS